VPVCADVCVSAVKRVPEAAGAYRRVRASTERAIMRIGLDQSDQSTGRERQSGPRTWSMQGERDCPSILSTAHLPRGATPPALRRGSGEGARTGGLYPPGARATYPVWSSSRPRGQEMQPRNRAGAGGRRETTGLRVLRRDRLCCVVRG
jgi:hypothetical protein